MTANEFSRWWKDFQNRFPSPADWLTDLDKRGGDPQQTLDAWAEALLDVDLPDAIEANKMLTSGDEQFPKYFRNEGWPALVRGIARRLVATRAPSRVEDWRERRYQCPDCLDSGRVEVVHPRLMEQLFMIFRGELKSEEYWNCHYRTATARCGACRRGEPRGLLEEAAKEKPGYRGAIERTARFSRERHVMAFYGDTEKDVDRIFADAKVIFEKIRQAAEQREF